MGGQACRLKVILNGAIIQDTLERLCYEIKEPDSLPIDDEYGYKMVELLNDAEDKVFKAVRLWLESQGFTGSAEQGGWPHALDFKKGP